MVSAAQRRGQAQSGCEGRPSAPQAVTWCGLKGRHRPSPGDRPFLGESWKEGSRVSPQAEETGRAVKGPAQGVCSSAASRPALWGLPTRAAQTSLLAATCQLPGQGASEHGLGGGSGSTAALHSLPRLHREQTRMRVPPELSVHLSTGSELGGERV